ncbi:hypothetical protein [Chenggangzhangella methanolivorans]|uniref:Uncharacterized protein n=1 Tax=Chenggangzhangella methanolivorans TaxID=1437009 RepID=A0A9E6RAR2_9HYPH|nr:hypothetical protein [Chenggangzhangella methanolivorans]QZN99772.1 hypothetical protein K6K41_24420 [Chenggangzhangella methanolivorans]
MSAAEGFSAGQRAKLGALTERLAPNDAAARAVCLADGIGVRHLARAIARRALSADPHLALCAVLKVDPVTLAPLRELARPPRAVAGPVAWWHLAVGLVIKREVDRIAIRDAAARVALSPATFVRAEQGRAVSTDAFFRLCGFLDLHPHDATARAGADPHEVAAANVAVTSHVRTAAAAGLGCFTGDIR